MDQHARRLATLRQPFSRADAAAAGIPAGSLRSAVASRSVLHIAKGVYAVRSPWDAHPPWVQHRHKAEAAARLTPDAIVSHASGAALLGLPHPAYPPAKVAMTLLDDVRTSRSDSWRRFHRGRTPAEHIVIRHGVPGFVPSRIAIDSGRELLGRDALAITDGVLRSGLASLDELLEMRRHQRRWPFIASTNAVLMLCDGRRENWLESASAWAISLWQLPAAVPQVNVYTLDGEFLGRPDLLWPEHGVVGEADGVEKYLIEGSDEEAVTQALRRESEREGRLGAVGLRFVRWSPKEAIDGAAINARFRRVADPTQGARVQAVYRCSCCAAPLEDCAVEADLARWRRTLAREFERTYW